MTARQERPASEDRSKKEPSLNPENIEDLAPQEGAADELGGGHRHWHHWDRWRR
jgi:hypothetical protein